jgi:outer membrane protein OmpA-like peptidoglycan-associated protein
MRYFVGVMSVGLLLASACSHPQNMERKDPLTDEVTGALAPTDPEFLKDDPATKVACRADAQCPTGALCHPEKAVCFTSYPPPEKIKVNVTCPLVPLYFAFDSTALVPEAKQWIDHDARCIQARGASNVVLRGFADARGEPSYNLDLSRRRAEVVKSALADHGVTVDVAVQSAGESAPLLKGSTEHDYAYNRRVELKTK